MKNAGISNIFNNIADLLEIKGENPFRIRAYRKAAFAIESLSKDVAGMTQEELQEIPGIGKDLSAKIEEFCRTGAVEAYENLKTDMPESLIDLFAVPGLGPKTVSLLYNKFKVKDIDQLEQLARGHKLAGIPGIKEKTEANILKGIELRKRFSTRHPIGRIMPLADEIIAHLAEQSPVNRISLAGSLRRWKESVQDIDIIATSKDPEAVMKTFAKMPAVTRVIMKGPTKSSVLLKEGIQVDIRVVSEDSYGAALAYFTGSKAHNIRLREIASKAGMKINEYGIFREKDDKKLGGKDEKDVYTVLGLQFVPPELREDTGEIEAAASGSLPELIALSDIKGDLHIHSNWSDGSEKLETLAETAKTKGYEYIAVTDHSKGLGVARGLDEKRLLEQKQKIDAINRKLKGTKILSGVEVNIKSDGSLDCDEAVLRQLDVVVASVHSGFRQAGDKITKRMISAMENPYVSVIAHPTGRLIGEREAYELDMEKVLEAAAKTGTAVEINAYPMRLDLSDSHVKAAKAKKVSLVISTDAHNSGQFEFMNYGVAVARRGWLEKEDVLNTLGAGRLFTAMKQKGRRK